MILLALVMSTFVACKPKPSEYDGNFTMTREIADQILSGYDLGDNVILSDGNSEYGYSINGDNFVVYEKDGDGNEDYYGKVGEDYYKIMIDSEGQRSHTKLAYWEAKLVLLEAKADIEEYFTIINKNNTIFMLEVLKEYGEEFGNVNVTGNGCWEKANDKIPQSAYIHYSFNMVESGSVIYQELEYTFSEKKLAYFTMRMSDTVEGYIPDDARNINTNSFTFNYSYDRVLTMPANKGEDVTSTYTTNVYMTGAFLSTLTNMQRGSKITLTEPQDEAFLGWYYDEEYQFPVEGLYQVGYDSFCEVYAKWQVPTVRVELNGGTFSAEAQSKISECVFIEDIRGFVPYKNGYLFEAWYFDADFQNLVTYSDDLISEDIVIYAKWSPSVKITLSADINYKLPKLVGAEGDFMRINYIKPVKRNGIFDGWYKDSNFTIPVTEVVFPASDATYYAKFDNAICVDINYENATLTIDLPKYINIPVAESEEYSFEDFFNEITDGYPGGSNANGEGFDGWYLDSALTQPLVEYPTADITVYPKIAPLYYYIIDAGEGALVDYYDNTNICITAFKWRSPIEECLIYAEIFIIPPEGKVFAGWYTDAALTQPYEPTEYPTENTTIYAAYVDNER